MSPMGYNRATNHMWFNEMKNKNVVMDYDVHNDAYSYDEDYSESSSEFMIAPSYTGGCIALSYAQESILSAIIRKLKSRLSSNYYVDENYGDGYNDCDGSIYNED